MPGSGRTCTNFPVSLTPVAITNSELSTRVAGRTVPLDFLATVRARPEAVALRAKDGDTSRTLTYTEYADGAARLAAALADLGVGRGTRVVMLMRNRPEFHVADIGVSARRRHADLDLQLLVGGADPVPRRALPGPRSRSSRRASSSIALLAVRDDAPRLRHVVVLDGAPEGTLGVGGTAHRRRRSTSRPPRTSPHPTIS